MAPAASVAIRRANAMPPLPVFRERVFLSIQIVQGITSARRVGTVTKDLGFVTNFRPLAKRVQTIFNVKADVVLMVHAVTMNARIRAKHVLPAPANLSLQDRIRTMPSAQVPRNATALEHVLACP